MKTFFLFISTLFLSVSTAADFSHTTLLRNQHYGPHRRNRMDVYLPQHRDSNTAYTRRGLDYRQQKPVAKGNY